MNDTLANVMLLSLTLLLPLSALLARRIPLGTTVRLALIWVLIFAVAAIVVVQVQRVIDRPGGDGATTRGQPVRVTQSADGHFWVDAQINGVTRRMLVDSGATTTALSSATARAAGTDLTQSRFGRMIDTANGPVVADTARAERLVVDTIETHDLPLVVSETFGDSDILGMNFLSRLQSWRVEERTLILTPPGD